MSTIELLVGILLVLVLLGLAGYFVVRQKKTLHVLHTEPKLNDDDKRYVRTQVRRRLLCSILMVVLAAMLVGWFFLRGELQPEPSSANKQTASGKVEMTETQKNKLRFATIYWCVALIVLFGIAGLATMDFMATARFSHRKFRNLENERQRVLEDQLTQWTKRRNGAI